MLQGIINRMAGNSANCKNWTITLVAAMLVLLVDKNMQIPNAWICLIPVGLFYLLDCYYLGLERITIGVQNTFLDNLNEDEVYTEELYKVRPLGDRCLQLCSTLKAIFSHQQHLSMLSSPWQSYSLVRLSKHGTNQA